MRDMIGEHSAESSNRQRVLNIDHDRLMDRRVRYRVSYYTLKEVVRHTGAPYDFIRDHVFLSYDFPVVTRCGEMTVGKYDLLVWLRTPAGREFQEMAKARLGAIDFKWVDGYDADVDGHIEAAGDLAHERKQGDGPAGVPVGPVRSEGDAVRRGVEVPAVDGERGGPEVAARKEHMAQIERPCSQSELVRRRREAEKVAPGSYIRVNNFLDRLKKVSHMMSHQDFLTLRGQAIHGDLKGAEKGLQNVLAKQGYVFPRGGGYG